MKYRFILIPVEIGLVRTFDRHADIIGLFRAQRRQFHTDAFEVRSVTWSYGDYEVLTYDDKHFVLPAEGTEVYELADSGRDFLSRDEKTLWLKGDTVDRLGLENLEVIGESADEAADDAAGEE